VLLAGMDFGGRGELSKRGQGITCIHRSIHGTSVEALDLLIFSTG
jgi:hypothetical protein